MFERLGAGVMARVLRRSAADARRAEDYEAVLAPIYAWIHAVAQSAVPAGAGRAAAPGASARAWQTLGRGRRRGGLRRRALGAGVGAGIVALNRAGLGPVRADFSGGELRRAGLLAVKQVLGKLSVRCEYAIFGHTHRAGPLPGDDAGEWVVPGGARLLNTGCWVHEPAFLGSRPLESPYRAGFAVLIDDGRPPALVNLLDQRSP
jgi:hypothetical protein